ncbi:MAG: prepilin-type N-terminal cleavage/methylation domain-containing protein [Patescibacteria group bacterium]
MKKLLVPKKTSSQAGFTLIEILVVIVIIGLLATIGASNFRSSQIKSRDAKRKADLKHVSEALEMFYNDHGTYPDPNVADGRLSDETGAVIDWGGEFSDTQGTIYMTVLPEDPTATNSYYYDPRVNSYQLYARLENAQDRDIPAEGMVYSDTDCGVQTCNYGVSSSNTTPVEGHSLVSDS